MPASARCFAYSRGAGPASRYPQDIARLQRTYFNSKDQLLHARDGDERRARHVPARRARPVFRRFCTFRVNSEPLLALGRAGLLARRRRIHPLARTERGERGA
jgi:hypothetical protein